MRPKTICVNTLGFVLSHLSHQMQLIQLSLERENVFYAPDKTIPEVRGQLKTSWRTGKRLQLCIHKMTPFTNCLLIAVSWLGPGVWGQRTDRQRHVYPQCLSVAGLFTRRIGEFTVHCSLTSEQQSGATKQRWNLLSLVHSAETWTDTFGRLPSEWIPSLFMLFQKST